MRRMMSSANAKRAGVVGAWVIVAFVALAGAAAMSLDLGRLVLSAQRCQDVADSSALAAATQLPYEAPARAAALRTAQANATDGAGWPVECTNSDIVFVGPNGTIDGHTLGPWAHAVKVTVRGPVEYTFAKVFGLMGATPHRSATVVRGPIRGVPIATMWIAEDTPLNYGEQINMLMADGPHYAGIPGSFGFLQSPPGCTADWFSLLQGYGLTYQDVESSFVNLGDTVYARTGVTVGNFKKALVDDGGKSRLERGTSGEFAGDTFGNYHPANPRIMLVPLVSFLGDTGSNAAFRIEKFGAFWLEGINQGQKEIWGRFIEFDMPGGDPDSQLTSQTGVFATKLIH
ncbi:MAG: hypothetical protein ACOX9R_08230 [Armatimonadota bacterium]|jgi:hypothetical protein